MRIESCMCTFILRTDSTTQWCAARVDRSNILLKWLSVSIERHLAGILSMISDGYKNCNIPHWVSWYRQEVRRKKICTFRYSHISSICFPFKNRLRYEINRYRQAGRCKRKPKASSFRWYRKLLLHVAAPTAIHQNVQKCDIFLNLRAFGMGAGPNEPPKRWQNNRSIRGSNPGPFPSLQYAAALGLLSLDV